MRLSSVVTYRTRLRLLALLAMLCAIVARISAGERGEDPNTNRVSAKSASEIREKRSLLYRGRRAVKKNIKNATFNLSDIEKRLKAVEER